MNVLVPFYLNNDNAVRAQKGNNNYLKMVFIRFGSFIHGVCHIRTIALETSNLFVLQMPLRENENICQTLGDLLRTDCLHTVIEAASFLLEVCTFDFERTHAI